MADRSPSAEHVVGLEGLSYGVFVLVNPVWEAQRRYIVNQYWVGAVRLLRWIGPHGKKSRDAGLERWFVSTVVCREVQREVHLSKSKFSSIAVQAWANIHIDDEHKEEIAAWEISPLEVLNVFSALVFDGYRLSVTYDEYSEALQVSLVCANPEDGNYECGLSARHPDIDVALRTLLYKHRLTADSGWRAFTSRPKGPNWS